jgi:hypothetical protein
MEYDRKFYQRNANSDVTDICCLVFDEAPFAKPPASL